MKGCLGCFVPIDWAEIEGGVSGAVLPVWWRKRRRTGSAGIAGKLALHSAGKVHPGKVTGGRVEHGAQSFAAGILCDRS